jgi:hypothetical protein
VGTQKIHGRNTQVFLAGVNLSSNTTNSQVELTADSHDITTYGKNSHVFQGGLLNGSGTVSGIYDKSVSDGPRVAVRPLIGTTVAFIHRPEGTGTGLPQDSVQVVVTKYTQTSPVADMVTWAIDLQFSDDVTYANQ